MRPATEADRPWIEATLTSRIAASMFPLSNLARHGWTGDHPRSMRFWIDRGRGAVLGTTIGGMLMPLVPDLDFSGARAALDGRTAIGALGDAAQVRPLLAAVGLAARPAKFDDDSPQFVLDLSSLAVPDGPGVLIPLADADRDLARLWRADYLSLLGEPPGTALKVAGDEIDAHAASGNYRVLIDGETPLAMTGFNARLPDIVQIGGVYTPPELRRRGLARRAVALHLAEAAGSGVARATLFAAGAPAIRAYEALGFRRIGSFGTVLFREPARVGA